jgi:hypothetical protein
MTQASFETKGARWVPRALAIAATAPLGLLLLLLIYCGNQAALGGSDSDGISGGDASFALTVTDDAFSPSILKTENLANVTLTLTNAGTKPHDFVVECMGSTCFPDASTIPPVSPDASRTVQFVAPYTEGLYTFRSNLPGDTQVGQFILQ